MNNLINDTFIKVYSAGDLLLHYDILKIELPKPMLPIVSLLLSNTVRFTPYRHFVQSYTFASDIQEYEKMLLSFPADLYSPMNGLVGGYNDGHSSILEYGIIIYCPVVSNVTFKNVIMFTIEDEDVKSEIEFKGDPLKMLLKLNRANKLSRDNPDYNCVMMGLSRSVQVTDQLLLNISKKYTFLNYEKLLNESSNREPLAKEYESIYNVFNCSVIEGKLIINNLPLLFYTDLELYMSIVSESLFDRLKRLASIINTSFLSEDTKTIKDTDIETKLMIKTIIAINTKTRINYHDNIVDFQDYYLDNIDAVIEETERKFNEALHEYYTNLDKSLRKIRAKT